MTAAAILAAYAPRYAVLLDETRTVRQQTAAARPFDLPAYLTALAEDAMVERVLIHQYDLLRSLGVKILAIGPVDTTGYYSDYFHPTRWLR